MAHDRLTNRTPIEIETLWEKHPEDLTFNELLALAGQRLAEKQQQVAEMGEEERGEFRKVDAGRDLALSHTALEDALTRYNSACYRIGKTWNRADPDGSVEYPGKPS